MNYLSIILFFLFLPFQLLSQKSSDNQTLFSLLPASHTGVAFKNEVPVFERMNVLISQYHYNGGGIAIGDVNNDGLLDLFFVANFGKNKLYLNKGNLQFEDITDQAGINSGNSWETGVTMVDINHDGWTDIYISRSGLAKGKPNDNILLINNGLGSDSKTPIFSSKALDFGLLDFSHSTQASFFDYDLDGDLDMYLLNHNVDRITNYDFGKEEIFRNDEVGDILMRNDDGRYTDVSAEAGIIGKEISYGLGVMIGDLNKDGWPDIYVCNDFGERDYLYINNQDGTFSEELKTTFDHIPYYSMGGDLGDINNDGWLDVMTLDMTSKDNYGQKANMNDMNPDKFYFLAEMGMHYQYMVNCLQLNNGLSDKTKLSFSEIAMMAGVAYTDWSWAPLFADFDNDGWQDLFISNGYRVNISNKDFVNWYQNRQNELNLLPANQRNFAQEFQEALSKLSSDQTPNYIFRNRGDLTFDDKTKDWGLDIPSFSNGVAYADLDNDGDLELIINNLDHEAHIYQNHAQELIGNKYLRIKLQGPPNNLWGIGTKLTLITDQNTQYKEFYVSRGYQSSVEPFIQFGLGKQSQIKQLIVEWFDGKKEIMTNIDPDQTITMSYDQAEAMPNSVESKKPLLKDISQVSNIDFVHVENDYDDFNKQVLLPHKLSQLGPALAVGDVNGDGLEDFYVGGAANQSGKLYFQQDGESFKVSENNPWESDQLSEDIDALFFDLEGDGDLDLYVVSGGNEFSENSPELQDRMYLNNGKGEFTKEMNILPKMLISGGCIAGGDYDRDGDVDLFIGGRLSSGKYLHAPRSFLLENENGKFSDVTSQLAPDLLRPGMVTDALWTDFDDDKKPDLIIVGEWMPLMMMNNQDKGFKNIASDYDLSEEIGWWNCVEEVDIDQDGDLDYLLGNLGENYKYQATESQPFEIFVKDFDENGSSDIVLGYYNQDTLYPVRGRQCSSDQIPLIKDNYSTYNEFAKSTLQEIYGDWGLDNALHIKAKNFSSSLLRHEKGKLVLEALPNRAQISPVNGFIAADVNQDKILDLVIAGNLYPVEVETPRADAGKGLVLLGEKDGIFSPVSPSESGFLASGDVKGIRQIKLGKNGVGVLVAINDAPLQLWKVNK